MLEVALDLTRGCEMPNFTLAEAFVEFLGLLQQGFQVVLGPGTQVGNRGAEGVETRGVLAGRLRTWIDH